MRNRKQLFSWLMVVMLAVGSIFSQADFSYAAAKKMKLSTSKVILRVKKSKTIKVKNAPKKAKFKWKSKNPKIARVSKRGKVTAKKKGTTKVTCTVTYPKGKKRIRKKLTATVKVKAAKPAVTPKPTAKPVTKASEAPKKTSFPALTPVKQDDTSFRNLSSDTLIQEMGAGWNLGNTMDGHTGFTPGETTWQPYKTTKQLIKSVHDMGFNTVRIPVTWGTMIDDENGYAIDERWMNRVQDIVDYCISQNMYAIINLHHDGAEQTGWLRIATDDQKALEEKFAGVWKNIATVFKDYDEHLILESMNEVKGQGMTVIEENAVIMKLNQIFVNTVRETGANNAKRWLMMPGKYNFIDSVCNVKNEFSLPQDSIENRLIVSVHDYSPWEFCGTESMSKTTCTEKMLEQNDKELQPLYDIYTSKGIPVVVGEYGCINKNNPEDRAYYLESMNRMFRKYKLVGVYWDQGWFDRSREPADYSFSIINRETGEAIEKQVTDGLLRGILGADGALDPLTVTKTPAIVPVTALQLPAKQLNLQMDEMITLKPSYEPANSNDVLLWKTDDPSVATVSYGTIIPESIGTTKITLYSQNSSQSAEISVTVTASASSKPCDSIRTAAESYQLEENTSAWLNAELLPADCDEKLYYQSADESVATVSSIGKIVAVGAGKTTITVGTSGGRTKTIPVEVSKAEAKKDISLAVNVYYNDSGKNYMENEVSSQTLTVNKDGQYTLSFDCDVDLSAKAKEAGISTLNNVTAIYIKDTDDASGNPLSACNIRYDKIEVDGTELTILEDKKGFKSALKDSGIFDTNDPINGWDGSAVEEVKSSNHSVSFTTITEPKKITITFTLDGMQFKE